jgi:hypothetical protein
MQSQVGDASFDDSFLAIDGDINATWDGGMCTLGNKTMSLKHFISSQILSQWLYISGARLGSDYWIYYSPTKPHNDVCLGS